MLQCTPQSPPQRLHLKLGAGFKRLAVEAVGFVADDASTADALSPLRIVPGETELSFTRQTPATSAMSDRVSGDRVASDSFGVAAWFASVARFVGLGVQHIVPLGFDHVLFVLGLTLQQLRLRTLMWQLAAFTVAHTVTLALSAFGVLSVSPRWVEPLIALSIVVVALANLWPRAREQGAPRVALCFGFGLVHGLGFAGALGALALPKRALVPALLGFNLGVELGQVLVAGCALLLLAFLRRSSEPRQLERWFSLAIAAAGLWLLWDRVG
jgi:hypothetical protein